MGAGLGQLRPEVPLLPTQASLRLSQAAHVGTKPGVSAPRAGFHHGKKEPTKLNGIKSGKTDDGPRGFWWGPLEREAARAPFLGVLLAREWPRPDLSFPR